MKRKRVSSSVECTTINDLFLKRCKTEFENSDKDKIAKNAITLVGCLNSTTDHSETTKISHVFLNSLKKKNLKATNQGSSGRCWLFSGLNMFRHHVINILNLQNFEFSETYLFFYDKIERSNCFLQWIKNNCRNTNLNDDKLFEYLIDSDKYMSDGGYWNFFANLVKKYGLLPKTAMPETFQSECSDEMNGILMNFLQSGASEIIKEKNVDKVDTIIEEVRKQVYSTLVKFLGEPCEKFDWSYTNEEGESNIIQGLTPLAFKDMMLPEIDLDDFVVLSNMPCNNYKFNTKYEVEFSTNIIEGNNCICLNIEMNELEKYAMKSVLAGIPVWIGADVRQYFHPYYSALNTKVINNDLIFGKPLKDMNKKERFLFKNQETCHAMTLTGVNIDYKNSPISWEVENSWGFLDNEEPGLDGFLTMSKEWFREYVGEIVIHKRFLSRSIQKILDKEAISVKPWDKLLPVLKIKSNKSIYLKYKSYQEKWKQNKM